MKIKMLSCFLVINMSHALHSRQTRKYAGCGSSNDRWRQSREGRGFLLTSTLKDLKHVVMYQQFLISVALLVVHDSFIWEL